MANVLSLFDGKSSGYTAMELAGIPITKYYSSEIDKYAIQVSNAIHPNQIRLGDVTKWREWDIEWGSIDYIFAGSPCQGLSIAGKQLALDDPRSALFYVFNDIKNFILERNPKCKIMLENVEIKGKAKESEKIITDLMECNPILINSALVSAQNRVRNYWCNWDVSQPKDREIMLSDILDPNLPSCGLGARIVGRRLNDLGKREDYNKEIPISQYLEVRFDGKSNCMTTVYKDSAVPYFKTDKRLKIKSNQGKASCLTGGANSGGNHSDMDILVIDPEVCRRYSIREAFRLQTVPEHYIDKIIDCGVSNSQLYKIAGNGWTDEVIAHILRC
jgi:site-specific DNA-cytosine methylase